MSDDIYRKNFGENFHKAMRNSKLGVERAKQEFKKKYPNADITKFTFNADLNNIPYHHISSHICLTKMKVMTLHPTQLKPNMPTHYIGHHASPSGTVQPLISTTNSLPFNVSKFNIYVTETGSFLSNFEKFNTSWQGTGKDITKVAVDRLDPYFASLLAAIIISHKGGICKKHLTGDAQTPKIITSIARYYVYYDMKRFLRDPNKMTSYISNAMLQLVKTNL